MVCNNVTYTVFFIVIEFNMSVCMQAILHHILHLVLISPLSGSYCRRSNWWYYIIAIPLCVCCCMSAGKRVSIAVHPPRTTTELVAESQISVYTTASSPAPSFVHVLGEYISICSNWYWYMRYTTTYVDCKVMSTIRLLLI